MSRAVRLVGTFLFGVTRRVNLPVVIIVVLVLPGQMKAALILQLTDSSIVTVGEIAAVNDVALTVAAVGERIRVERTIPWPRIAAASADGQLFSVEELRLANGLPAEGREPRSEREVPAGAPGFALLPFVAVPHSPLAAPCSPVFVPCSPPVLPPYGRVIGVRPDPLAAYADLIPSVYPYGVPSAEAPFALALLRERRRLEAVAPFYGPAGIGGGPGLTPGPPLAPAVPFVPMPGPPSGGASPVPGDLSQIEARVVPLRAGGGSDVNALGVELAGSDLSGRTVPAEGTVQAILYAGRQTLFHAFDDVYAPKPEGLVRLAEWTRAAALGERLVLPLPEPLPEHDPQLSELGSLRVRLSVPGSGVFETVAEPVVIRPASPLRDAIRSQTGSRFRPDEQTTGRRGETWPFRRDFTSAD